MIFRNLSTGDKEYTLQEPVHFTRICSCSVPEISYETLYLLGSNRNRNSNNRVYREIDRMFYNARDIVRSLKEWDEHMEEINPIDIKKTEEILMSWC